MSRTYRRKNETQDYYWVLREWHFRRTYFDVTHHDKNSQEGKRRIKVYHSDAQCTMDNAPSWFKLIYARRPFRRKEQVALIKAVKYIEEDIPFPVRRKSVLWDYW
jgi:hypothetical protein